MHLTKSLPRYPQNNLVRLIVGGAAGDGTSTLIQRLVDESVQAPLTEGPVQEGWTDATRYAPSGQYGPSSLSEEQVAAVGKPTLDPAASLFSTWVRNYVVCDLKGLDEPLINLIEPASRADLAILLVDARKGVTTRTRHQTYLFAVLGVPNILLIVNKMDMIGFDQGKFECIQYAYRDFVQRLGFERIAVIPISARGGENIVERCAKMAWYDGTALMPYLDSVASGKNPHRPLRMQVQSVPAVAGECTEVAGTVVSGIMRRGDLIKVLPAARTARVTRISNRGTEIERADVGDRINITLGEEVYVREGDVISRSDAPAEISDQFQANVVWLYEEPLLPGRSYVMQIGPCTVTANVTSLRYKIAVDNLDRIAARQLAIREIGLCNLATDRPIAFDSYRDDRETGSFVLIDANTSHTVGAGTINFALRRADNIHWQAVDVHKAARAEAKGQTPCVLWFTGLSGAGKSTIANLVEKRLHALGRHTYLLDGDNVRHGLNKDLGFTEADRVENVRRIAEVAKLMADAGLIVLVSFISPFRAERKMARSLFEPGEFYEIFIDTPLEEAERRDAKGLYKKARRGELKNFTGIDSPYESPEQPEIHIDTTLMPAEHASALIISRLAGNAP